MKHFKFSLIFATMMVAALLVFAGCKPADDPREVIKEKEKIVEKDKIVEKTLIVRPLEVTDGIVGTWRGTQYSDKFEVTTTSYNNYYSNGTSDVLYYSTNTPYLLKINDTSGYLYSKFNDADHLGYNASINQWYAFYYSDLTANSVNISQAAKTGGVGGCNTLAEAISEFTLANDYVSTSNSTRYSACTRE